MTEPDSVDNSMRVIFLKLFAAAPKRPQGFELGGKPDEVDSYNSGWKRPRFEVSQAITTLLFVVFLSNRRFIKIGLQVSNSMAYGAG